MDGWDVDLPTTLEANYITHFFAKTLWVFSYIAVYGVRPLLVRPKPVGEHISFLHLYATSNVTTTSSDWVWIYSSQNLNACRMEDICITVNVQVCNLQAKDIFVPVNWPFLPLSWQPWSVILFAIDIIYRRHHEYLMYITGAHAIKEFSCCMMLWPLNFDRRLWETHGVLLHTGVADLVNIGTVLAFDALTLYFWGFKSLMYMLLGNVFGGGLHPMAGHLIAEHYTFSEVKSIQLSHDCQAM